jgi:WD40 repeat protein
MDFRVCRKQFLMLVFLFASIQSISNAQREDEIYVCILNRYQQILVNVINAITVNSEGTLLAISTPADGVFLYDVETLELVSKLVVDRNNNFGGTAMAWKPSGSHLVSYINSEIGLVVWDLDNGEIDYTISIQDFDPIRPIESLAWSSSGRYIAFTGSFLPLWIWDTAQQEFTLRLEREEPHYTYLNLTNMVSWHPNQDILAFIDGSQIKLWDAQLENLTTIHFSEDLTGVIGVDWSASGNLAINGGISQPIAIHNSKHLDNTAFILNVPTSIYHHEVFAIEWSPDEAFIATGGDTAINDNVFGGDIVVRNVYTGDIPIILTGHQNRVFDIEWSSNGNYIFSISFDWDVFRWDIENECPNSL